MNTRYLQRIAPKYRRDDLFNAEDLVQDYIRGCCPDIPVDLAYDYLRRTRELVEQHRITCEGVRAPDSLILVSDR
ncbi:MAG TPA: hypothetical protein PKJ98_15530 [Verrucomicrobiota bacterium]|nr:hypothetical protein [Verrucomicrobiota bacterium]